MKTTKLPQQLAKNASKLHKHIGELLNCNDSPYKNYEIRQEYHVSKVNPDYKSNREKFDWAILGLNVVIEINGEQHYRPICFGGIDIEKAKRNFLQRLRLDERKQTAAETALWAYVVVKYTEKNITLEELITKISEALNVVPDGIYIQSKPKVSMPKKDNYQWPTKKLQSRPFQKKEKNDN